MDRSTSSDSQVAIAAFDFDGTLIAGDSLFPFLRLVGGGRRLCAGLVLAACLGGFRRDRLKEMLLQRVLGGSPVEPLEERAASYAERLRGLIRPAALERVRWHQQQGHDVAIVSATLEVYLVPLARRLGIDTVLGTRLEVRGGAVTGRIEGANCRGQEKVRRLQERFGALESRCLYAYGDSRGDRELLAAARHACWRPFRS